MGARKKSGIGGWLLFWLVFFIGITLLFTLNMERIKGTIQELRVLDRLVNKGKTAADHETSPEPVLQIPVLAEPDQNSAMAAGTAVQAGVDEAGLSELTVQPSQENIVERAVYLMKVDSAGTLLWAPVKRGLPASGSPLQDTLEELIRGPSASEEKLGLITLIPAKTRILNTFVRGSTAYISFNEDFLFNTYGVEGYAGQRQQIVLTATEFSNVKDVQILIDGMPVEYLGENIWIGTPISRNML